MTVIKINAITVPEGSGDELARRFAARAGAVDDQPGFAHGHRGADRPTESGAPVSVSAELWNYEVAGGSAGNQG